MLALCVAVAALGVVFFPPLLGLAAAVSLTGTGAAVATGLTFGGTSLLLGAGGLSFWAKGTKQGLSAAC